MSGTMRCVRANSAALSGETSTSVPSASSASVICSAPATPGLGGGGEQRRPRPGGLGPVEKPVRQTPDPELLGVEAAHVSADPDLLVVVRRPGGREVGAHVVTDRHDQRLGVRRVGRHHGDRSEWRLRGRSRSGSARGRTEPVRPRVELRPRRSSRSRWRSRSSRRRPRGLRRRSGPRWSGRGRCRPRSGTRSCPGRSTRELRHSPRGRRAAW